MVVCFHMANALHFLALLHRQSFLMSKDVVYSIQYRLGPVFGNFSRRAIALSDCLPYTNVLDPLVELSVIKGRSRLAVQVISPRRQRHQHFNALH